MCGCASRGLPRHRLGACVKPFSWARPNASPCDGIRRHAGIVGPGCRPREFKAGRQRDIAPPTRARRGVGWPGRVSSVPAHACAPGEICARDGGLTCPRMCVDVDESSRVSAPRPRPSPWEPVLPPLRRPRRRSSQLATPQDDWFATRPGKHRVVLDTASVCRRRRRDPISPTTCSTAANRVTASTRPTWPSSSACGTARRRYAYHRRALVQVRPRPRPVATSDGGTGTDPRPTNTLQHRRPSATDRASPSAACRFMVCATATRGIAQRARPARTATPTRCSRSSRRT